MSDSSYIQNNVPDYNYFLDQFKKDIEILPTSILSKSDDHLENQPYMPNNDIFMDTHFLDRSNIDTPFLDCGNVDTPFLDCGDVDTPYTNPSVFTPSRSQFTPYMSSYNNQTGVGNNDPPLVNYICEQKESENILDGELFGTAEFNEQTYDSLFKNFTITEPNDIINSLTIAEQNDDFIESNSFQSEFLALENMYADVSVMPFTNLQNTTQVPISTEPIPSKVKDRRKKKLQERKNKSKHICNLCDATFDRKYNLDTHIRTHDKNRKKKFSCETCEKQFDRKHDKKRHISTVHKGVRAFSCQVCHSQFSRKDAMGRHELQKHGIGQNK